ncbi:MAG: sulfatase-like hydrolase/transferase [Verrucomicrobiota bacterium]
MKPLTLVFSFLASLLTLSAFAEQERPNLLWITSEDNGRHLGCYGDPKARTPHLDALAAKGIRYTHCFANAPVCAPTRNSWIFGTLASTLGTHQMRSKYRVPRDQFKTYPELLRKVGYYATNRSKTDYNTSSIKNNEIWDECSKNAHYKNGPEAAPFFAVFNLTISHESQVFPDRWKGKEPETTADQLPIPPYQLKIPEVLTDWQRYYDQLEKMDTQVGEILEELEASGKAEDTIIAYCSDHGGITLRSKRYLHDSGTRVPFMMYFPEKWKHLAPQEQGSVSDRLVQFIDMPKTWLSLAGIEAPESMSGHVIAGPDVDPAPETVYLFSGRFDEAPDTSRAVTDGQWKYIRNFETDRPRFQMLYFPMRQDGQTYHALAHQQGKTDVIQAAHYQAQVAEELYDTDNDPHEVNNLAQENPEMLKKMRQQLHLHAIESRDTGFIPELVMEQINSRGEETIYEYGQSDEQYPLEKVYQLACAASDQNEANLSQFQEALSDENLIVRHWGAMGLRMLAAKGEIGKESLSELKKALQDPSTSVVIPVAVALGYLGEEDLATSFLLEIVKKAESDMEAAWALDGLKLLNQADAVSDIPVSELNKGKYSGRIVKDLKNGSTSWTLPLKE